MTRKTLLLFAVIAALELIGQVAHGQLRVVTYNTLDKPANASEDALFQTIFDAIDSTSTNGIAKRADIIAVQEQSVFSGGVTTASRMAAQLNSLYGVSSYLWGLSSASIGSDRVGIVYDSSTVDFLSAVNVSTGGPRPAYRAQFRPVGYTSSDATLYVYSSHLKASQEPSDYETRDAETTALNNNAGLLGAGANFIIAGDLNIYNNTDQAYTNLTGPSALGNDPLALASWPSSGTQSKYLTQSTRTTSEPDGGATGGIDDRFDHQVISDSLLDGEGLTYIGPTSTGLGGLAHSYQSFGNDGVSYNQAINNTYVGRSQSMAVIDALYDFSDHLPVVADYQLPAKIMASLGKVPTNVDQNDIIDIDVLIENIASVMHANGADELDYTIGVSGALSPLDLGGTAFALAGSQTKHVRLNTSTLGPQVGMVTVTPTSQAAAGGVLNFPVNFTVGPGGGGPVFGVIARDDFDSPLNLNSFVQSPLPNTFSDTRDGFQEYQVGVSSSIPFGLVDDSTNGFPTDTLGVINSATKSDAWFGVVDLDNDNNPSGTGTATWVFDVSGATGLEVSIDMGAMGDFEVANDSYNWTYSFDGGSALPLFTSSVNEALAANYTMADGDVINLPDPLFMTDAESQVTQLTNVLQTLTSELTGTGSTLTITFSATNDGEESYAFDNIIVEGFTGGDFLEADFNEDTDVDAEDLALWEGGYGLNADGDADDDVDTDGADFLIWQQQSGQSSDLVVASHAVPEPATILLLVSALPFCHRRRPR